MKKRNFISLVSFSAASEQGEDERSIDNCSSFESFDLINFILLSSKDDEDEN